MRLGDWYLQENKIVGLNITKNVVYGSDDEEEETDALRT